MDLFIEVLVIIAIAYVFFAITGTGPAVRRKSALMRDARRQGEDDADDGDGEDGEEYDNGTDKDKKEFEAAAITYLNNRHDDTDPD